MQSTLRTWNNPQRRYFWQWIPASKTYVLTQNLAFNGIYDYERFQLISGFGRNDPRWKKIPTSGQYEVTRAVNMQGTLYYRNNGLNAPMDIQSGFFGDNETPEIFSAGYTSLPSFPTSVYNDCLSKLYDQMYSSELNLAVSIGEWRETKRMVANAVRSLRYLTKTARDFKRDLRRNPSLLASRQWLGYKYGILPAYNDVYNLLRFTSKKFSIVQFKARRSRVEPVKASFMRNGHLTRISGQRFYRSEVSCWASAGNQSAFDISRVTSLNPLTIAWELMPFSFVVDWFVDIGGYLEAQERALAVGLVFHDGYRTYVNGLDVKESWTYNLSAYPYTQGTLNASFKKVNKTRERLTNFPKPQFPSIDINLGSQRILSGAALLRTVLLGKVKS